MATASSRYYSEDGRATKRQKTDGMATVSSFGNLIWELLFLAEKTRPLCFQDSLVSSDARWETVSRRVTSC